MAELNNNTNNNNISSNQLLGSNSLIPQTNISYSAWQSNSSEVVRISEDGTKVGSVFSWKTPSNETSTQSHNISCNNIFLAGGGSGGGSSTVVTGTVSPATGLNLQNIASSSSPTLPTKKSKFQLSSQSISTHIKARSCCFTYGLRFLSKGPRSQKTFAVLPKLSLRQMKSYRHMFFSGPFASDESEVTSSEADAIAARTVSLFPMNATGTQRQVRHFSSIIPPTIIQNRRQIKRVIQSVTLTQRRWTNSERWSQHWRMDTLERLAKTPRDALAKRSSQAS